MRAAEIALAGALVDRFPGLTETLQEHLDVYDSLLPHVLMGDVTRWVVSQFLAGQLEDLRRILDFLEARFRTGNEHERELIAVSFLENLPRPGESGAGVRELLGPGLRRQLELIG